MEVVFAVGVVSPKSSPDRNADKASVARLV